MIIELAFNQARIQISLFISLKRFSEVLPKMEYLERYLIDDVEKSAFPAEIRYETRGTSDCRSFEAEGRQGFETQKSRAATRRIWMPAARVSEMC